LGSRKNIENILKEIDVFVLPSLSEGLGLSLIEALVSGKLVIASNVGGIKELIEDKKNGLLTRPAHVNDLHNAIIWVLDNKEDAMKIRNNSLEWIDRNRSSFDIKGVCNNYSKVFEEINKKN